MPERGTQFFNLSTGTIVRFFAVLLGIIGVYIIRDILASLIFGVIIASALEPGILWLKERGIPRILGVILIYVALAFIFFFIIYLVFPLIFDEFRSIASAYPTLQKQILSGIDQAGSLPFLPYIRENLTGLFNLPSEYLGKLSSGLFDFASVVFGGIFSFILIVIFSIYLATQEKGIENFLRLVVPLKYESYVIDLWDRSQKKLGKWLRAQMLLGAIVGVLVFFGLTFLGIEHALFFAALAALFEIIPVVGPILAAIPAVVTAFFLSPFLGLSTVILYVVVQQIESHVIIPVVMRKAIGLSPLIVVFALLVGGKLGGLFGILLAVPVTAIVAELVNDWDKKKRSLIPE